MFRSDVARGPCLVFNDDRLLPLRLEMLREQPRDQVRRRARSKWHDDTHRLVRKGLRRRSRRQRDRMQRGRSEPEGPDNKARREGIMSVSLNFDGDINAKADIRTIE